MKMSYFFLSKEVIPWPFKLCGCFQAACDAYLAWQFVRYGSGGQEMGIGLGSRKGGWREGGI